MVSGKRATMRELASALSRHLDRPVVDRTGLAGEFDFVARTITTTATTWQPGGPDEPRIFGALRAQLALKLESTSAPVEVLEIGRVQPPSAD